MALLAHVDVLAKFVEEGQAGAALPVGVEAPVADQTLAERVKRTHIHFRQVVGGTRVLGDVSEKCAQALAQLERRLLGKRREKDLIGAHVMEDEEVEGAPEEHTGLP